MNNSRDIIDVQKLKNRITIVILTLILGIILTLFSYMIPIDNSTQLILLTFGATFLASAIISFIMVVAGFWDIKDNAHELAEIIGNKLEIPCAERYEIVDSSVRVGLSKTYIDRISALQRENFYKNLEKENNNIFIIGSSLLGLLQNREFEHVRAILEKKIKEQIELKFMLTHPLFADLRAAQEGRNSKEIGVEIIKSLNIIKSMKGDRDTITVYLYTGTPTCFGICTTTSMLINPYPYGGKAYQSPCFTFNAESPAYNFYLFAHFNTQFGGKIKEIKLTDEEIKTLNDNNEFYSSEITKFNKILES